MYDEAREAIKELISVSSALSHMGVALEEQTAVTETAIEIYEREVLPVDRTEEM